MACSILWRVAVPVACFALLLLSGRPASAQDQSGITSPAPGAAISGDVPIFGTAVIDPFQKYELHFKQEPSGNDAYIYFYGGTSPVANGQLGVWQAGGLPPGTYSLRLRVVKQDGNYAETFVPNLSVNQGPVEPTATPTSSEVTPTSEPTATFTPAPQPTPSVGQVDQPQVEGEEAPAAGGLLPTATPVAAGNAEAAAGGQSLTDVVGDGGTASTSVTGSEEDSLTRQLGEALALERLRTYFMNGVRIAAALFVGLGVLLFGKRLFEWVLRRFNG